MVGHTSVEVWFDPHVVTDVVNTDSKGPIEDPHRKAIGMYPVDASVITDHVANEVCILEGEYARAESIISSTFGSNDDDV